MEKHNHKKTGMVIHQDTEWWIQLDQYILDLRKIGVDTNRSKEAAKLMRIGLLAETKYNIIDPA